MKCSRCGKITNELKNVSLDILCEECYIEAGFESPFKLEEDII